ncbi:MAG: hypothetical protein LQ340_002496 [Diploschistes diacapsis]|nr:MAG: hypothetical protein LQ340_002496 [Diploschistes diacapsis]
MRDNHLDEYHQRREPQEHSIVLMPDPDEVQPLLFDLVQADNFDAVKALLPSFVILDWPIQFELLKITAASGSGALLKLLLQSGTKRNYLDGFDLPSIAITNNNISTFEYLLQQVLDPAQQNVPNHHYIPRAIVSDTLGEVLRSDSMDIYDMWEKYVDFEFQYHLRIYKTQRDGRERLKRARFETKSSVAISFTDPRHLSSIQGHPHREQLVYHLWKNKGIIKALNSEDLGRALAHVARSCCSVRLAKCLIEAGAKVDHRRSVKYMTPLHYAASSSTAEAAELMRFLLLSGANPNAMCKGTKQSIRDKKGAKGISKWLGISFDELVVQTKKEREEREAQADSGS